MNQFCLISDLFEEIPLLIGNLKEREDQNSYYTNFKSKNRNWMAEGLSAQNLAKSLLQKDKYKATQAYLHQVTLFNQPIYQMFNQALTNVLLKPNLNYMSKLMALRLFKEIVVAANFTLIDALDEKLQDLILATAKYNKKSKQINRGANYFVDVDKQKKEGDILKIGATFVLLASEIIVVLAKWYSVDEEGEQTRFSQYYKELQSAGVTLPQENQLNFFKKDDQEKFRKNYSSWLKWYVQKVKEQEVQQTTRQIKQEQIVQKARNVKASKKNSQLPEKTVQLLDKKTQIAEEKAQVPTVKHYNANNSTLNIATNINQTTETQKVGPKVQKIDEIDKNKSIVQTKLPKQVVNTAEKEKLQNQKWKQQLISKYQRELHALRGQSSRMKKQVDQATNTMSKVHQQKVKLQEQLHTKKKEICELASQKLELQTKINTLNKPQGIQQNSEYFQIKITPPSVYEQLQDQNDVLQSALEAAQNLFLAKKQQLQQQLALIREQNSKLSHELLQKEQQIKKYKEQVNVEKQLLQNIIKEDQLANTEEVKHSLLQSRRQVSQTKQKQNLLSKTCTMSQYLKSNHKQYRQNVQPRIQSRNKSLRKTQSTHKLSSKNTCQGFFNTGISTIKNVNVHQKLSKTSNAFYSKKAFQSSSSNLITIFPFLHDYFPLLPSQSKRFKSNCLSVEKKLGTCFENDIVKVSLNKINCSHYILVLTNKLNLELKVKITSEHRSFVVLGDKIKKIKAFASEQLELSNIEFDINLRYLSLNLVTGNQKLSLINSITYDRTFSVPLPITLLDFCKLSTQNSDFPQKGTRKYCSNKLSLSSCQSNLMQCLTLFKVSYKPSGLSAKAIAELYSETESKVLIEVMQTQYQVCISVEFFSDHLESNNLAKVLLQVMLFLLQV